MSSEIWHTAVWEDGTDVMYEVTVRLYPGKLPPQSFLSKEVYYKVFDTRQRNILESWEENGTFEIYSLAKEFDISLHYAVQKHVCKLGDYENLSKKVKSLVNKRNDVAHSPFIYKTMNGDLIEELGDLLNLYMDVLEDLEFYTGDSLTAQKHKIRNSMESRKMRKVTYKYYEEPQVPHYSRPKPLSTQQEESSGMSDFTKVALGVGVAGAVGIGLSALIGAFMGEKKNKEKT